MEQYQVTGMSCAACSSRVEKAVSAVPGVTSCSVSLLTNSMGVEGSASPETIIQAVTDAGYGASLKKSGENKAGSTQTIYDDMNTVLSTFKPEVMAIEKLFFNTNQKTGIDVAQARGVTLLAATNMGIPIYEYTPLQVKQSVVGYGRAEKPQVMEMTRRILGLATVPKPDDTADALAIAICHGHASGGVKIPKY